MNEIDLDTMVERMNLAQIRASIFYPQTIGFTPENGAKYKDMFLPDAAIAPAGPFPEMPFGNLPLGMPWQLVRQDSDNNGISVVFLPNKIDIVKNIDTMGDNTEIDFIQFCSEKFKIFLDDIKMDATRLAYCPLLAMDISDVEQRYSAWQHVIRQTSVDGAPCQHVNLSFLIKKEKQIGQEIVDVNFLFKMMDGFKLKNGIRDSEGILVQLDINTVPNTNYMFNAEGIRSFMQAAKNWKNEFVETVLK